MPIDGPKLGSASGEVDSLVIFCHGYGADGADLISLAPYWQRILPNTAFAAPNAPEPCDMGGGGYQWFAIARGDPIKAQAGVEQAAPILEAFIAEQLEGFGLTGDRLALVGFSQGTIMSLHVGLRRAAAPAAIIGFSGALIGAEQLGAIEARPPVLLIHGANDPMISHQATITAAQALSDAGFDCAHHIIPDCGHGIAPDGLELGGRFLHQHLIPRG